MDAKPFDDAGDPRQGRLLHVSALQFVGCLAVALAIFFFATGRLWRHAADIRRLDSAIFWSYAAIPILIAGCLLASRHWTLRGFLLDTMALTLTKYVITASIAITLWATEGDPKGAAPLHLASPPVSAVPEPAVVPTRIDPATTGAVDVTVSDPDGKPVAGALVYVAGGLEGLVFAPPQAPVSLTNDGHGVAPALSVVEVGQRIEGRSADGRLHTLVVRRDGGPLFNVPLLSSGAPTTVRAGDAPGLATVRCNVHPQAEEEARMLLVANPFHAWSDAAGRVVWRGVPAGTLRLSAIFEGRTGAEATVQLAAGKTVDVRLQARRP